MQELYGWYSFPKVNSELPVWITTCQLVMLFSYFVTLNLLQRVCNTEWDIVEWLWRTISYGHCMGWSWPIVRYYSDMTSFLLPSKFLKQKSDWEHHTNCTYQPMLGVNIMGYKNSVTPLFFYQLQYLVYSLSIWWHVSCRVYLVEGTFIPKQVKLTVTTQCSKLQ